MLTYLFIALNQELIVLINATLVIVHHPISVFLHTIQIYNRPSSDTLNSLFFSSLPIIVQFIQIIFIYRWGAGSISDEGGIFRQLWNRCQPSI